MTLRDQKGIGYHYAMEPHSSEMKMELKLESVVPWGRSWEEYTAMFALTSEEMRGQLLDCGGGPSSFNAESHDRGNRVISCDPIYRFTAEEIGQRVDETAPKITAITRENQENFLWHRFSSPAQLAEERLATMRRFLTDYPQGKTEGRYVTGALPDLPFAAGTFDLALCSHLLFTYSEQLPLSFHLDALLEMCRVAAEVRVFPLLVSFTGQLSPHLEPVIAQLQTEGYPIETRMTAYEFQKGGNQMLSISVRRAK